MAEPMRPDRLFEIHRIPVTNDAPLPWTVEPRNNGFWYLVDARGNIVAAVPSSISGFALRIAEAFEAIPELVAEITRLRPELSEAIADAAANEWVAAFEGDGERAVTLAEFPAGTSDEQVSKFKQAWTGGPLKTRLAGEDDVA